ncbi:UDP-N-acetylmuramoyl-L-alanine--D-glutamate ligase [Emcibacter sp. SYSU 3D8]|uniref:UDP-N-acetylmuramoyl-L-alanine--D-glutamate ligase n=1 Tax=Emcibacter sp. SYSU 3D8 TaxID=3133969 RepID=UPI0031FF475B
MIPVTSYQDRPVAVFGLARSGIAAARALAAGGAAVTAWDDNPKSRDIAAAAGVALVPSAELDWSRQAALVLSPGVPLTHPVPHPVVASALAAGLPIIGDIDLFAQAEPTLPRHSVAVITGTNGKSTTTALLAHLVEACGRASVACGNIGTPILDLEPLPSGGVYVIEMSSYQIDLTFNLRPEVAILLNTSPDHLDRHGGMVNYAAIKRRIFDWQAPGGAAIIGVDDDYGREAADRLRASGRAVTPVTVMGRSDTGVSVEDAVFFDAAISPQPVLSLDGIESLRGRHNWQNAAAAYAAARALGFSTAAIEAGLRSFPGLAHRLEYVGTANGVRFVNDSKATNADATGHALAAFGRVHWIAGGKAKDGGIDSLKPLFGHVERAYLIGEAQDAFAESLDDAGVDNERCGTMEQAVASAARHAGVGEVVLLSPACASFDQYPNFEVRGDHFRALVAQLAREPSA